MNSQVNVQHAGECEAEPGNLRVECLSQVLSTLGESPVWSSRQRSLYWADIERDLVYTFDEISGCIRTMPVDIGITAIAPCTHGGWLAASRTGLYLLDSDFSQAHFLLDVENTRPNVRFNDAVVDRRGHLWAGTLNESRLEAPDGALFRIDGSFSCKQQATGFAVANGIAFSPNNSVLYAVDMFRRRVLAYPHDGESGTLGESRILVELDESEGMPDGLTVDCDGGLWVCHWDGGCVSRYDSDGHLTWRLPMPVSRVTRCCFGGLDLHDLYIATARFELDAETLAREPDAGGLFRVRVPWRGLPESQFQLDVI